MSLLNFTAPSIAERSSTVSAKSRQTRMSMGAMDLSPGERDRRVAIALEGNAMFKGCCKTLTDGIAEHAERRRLDPGEELVLAEEDALFIIEYGAVSITVGDGPSVTLGSGTVLNVLSMLGLQREAKAGTGAPSKSRPVYELCGAAEGAEAPALFEAQLLDRTLQKAGGIDGDSLCFYALCPQAGQEADPGTPRAGGAGPLTLEVVGAPEGAVPHRHCNRAEYGQGGALLATVTLELVKEVAGADFTTDKVAMELMKSMAVFEQNGRELRGIWRTILSSGRAVFGGMPAEVAWAAAEASERRQAEEGEVFVREGEVGEDGECIYIIEEGTANVEKLVGLSLYETAFTHVGSLSPGTVIGDLRFLGSGLPRPASARATASLKAVRLSASGLLSVVRIFPGVLRDLRGPLEQWATFLSSQPSLQGDGPLHTITSIREVLFSSGTFAACGSAFLDELAGMAQWMVLRCGEVLKDVPIQEAPLRLQYVSEGSDCQGKSYHSEGKSYHSEGTGRQGKSYLSEASDRRSRTFSSEATDRRDSVSSKASSDAPLMTRVVSLVDAGPAPDSVYVVAYGRLGVQCSGRGLVRELVAGHSVDPSELAESRYEVVVLTPVALVVAVRSRALQQAQRRYPEQVAAALTPDQAMAQVVGQVDVFKKCGPAFIDAICGTIEVKSFLPGQTLMVLGARDASQMFLLRSGHVAVERCGSRLATKSAGTAMGELAMLGIVGSRSATVRAMTFCTVMEVPRSAFVAALESFPEERGSFEQLAMKNIEMRAVWPFLKDVASRMHLFLNMHAAFRAMPAGDRSLKALAKDAAILVMSGEVAIIGPDGEELQVLVTGESFNEQVLLGVRNHLGTSVVPKTPCEVQILEEETWAKMQIEFPDEQEGNRQRILKWLWRLAELRRGLESGGTVHLHGSGLFRTASDEFAALVCQSLKGSIYKAGQVIIEAGQEADYMLLLVEGKVLVEPDGDGPLGGFREFESGAVFGEALAVGAAKTYPRTLRASSEGPCLFQQLHRSDLKQILSKRSFDRCQFDALAWRGRRQSVDGEDGPDLRHHPDVLGERLRLGGVFRGCTPAFSTLACRDADDVFFAPGEVVIASGETCVLGVTPCFVLLSGQATVETATGITLGTIITGQLFGEAGALGLATSRTATVRASRVGLVHCAKLHGRCIQAALDKATEREEASLRQLFKMRQAENITTMRKRAAWLDAIVPTIRISRLFADWPQNLLEAMVAPLVEATYAPGELISSAGEAADSMLVVLEGVVQIETATGERIGLLREGASIGEVAALGLFPSRTATARAATGPGAGNCRVLTLPHQALQASLVAPGAEAIRERLEKVVADRNDQVLRGLPISALPLGVSAEDLTARAVALQAERVDLTQGEAWLPAADEGPCGAHFCVFVKGRACLEVAADGRVVMPLGPGNLLLEGQAVGFGAQVRAVTACEAYRVRETDLTAVAFSVKGSQDWYYRFRLFEKTSREEANYKLRNALGCSQCLTPHPSSAKIQSWTGHRKKCMDHAEEKRKAWYELRSKNLPRVSSAPAGLRSRDAQGRGSQPPQRPTDSPTGREPPQQRPGTAERRPASACGSVTSRARQFLADREVSSPALAQAAPPPLDTTADSRQHLMDRRKTPKDMRKQSQESLLLSKESKRQTSELASSKVSMRRPMGPGMVHIDSQALAQVAHKPGSRAATPGSRSHRRLGAGHRYCW